MQDLVALVADKDIEYCLYGIFARHAALCTRSFTFKIHVHPQRDPGCLRRSEEFLRPLASQYHYGLVVFDRSGCGSTEAPQALEKAVADALSKNGWQDRCGVVAIDPELEIWVWRKSPHVSSVIGWPQGIEHLYSWLQQEGYLPQGQLKPSNPKEALEKALRIVGRPRSSAIYGELASKVSLKGCVDCSFNKLITLTTKWFPPT